MDSEKQRFKWYVLFPNHHEGLRLSQALKEKEIPYSISPTPRAASSDCGISLMVEQADLPAIEAVIATIPIRIDKIVKLPVTEWKYRSC